MSTTTKPNVTNNSTIDDGQKENTTEKDKVKDGKELIKEKESKFYELVDLLENGAIK